MQEEIEYRVHYQRMYPYHNQSNYQRSGTNDDWDCYLTADSIEELYESMGKLYVNWKLHGEEEIKRDNYSNYSLEDYHINFSEIYTVVGEFSEEKLKETQTYLEMGKARDELHAKRKREAEEARKRSAEYALKQKEEFDRQEYARLQRKFGKN